MMIIGEFGVGSLEGSYYRAALKSGFVIEVFEPLKEQKAFLKGGSAGQLIHKFLPVDAWSKKMNRKWVSRAISFGPDVILCFTNTRVLPGALASIKALRPKVKLVWIWPDPPLSLETHTILNGRLVDLTATFSSSSVAVLDKLGFFNVRWIPLAADPDLHAMEVRSQGFLRDIGFVGGWRPEREEVLSAICEAFPDLVIEIHGPYWKRDCKNRQVRKRVKGPGLYEKDLATFFNTTKVNLNVMDQTHFMSANMRFFEIPVAGGLQLSSACPEMEGSFHNMKHVIYFSEVHKITEQLKWIFNHPLEADKVRRAGNKMVMGKHTYIQRFDLILEHLGLKQDKT